MEKFRVTENIRVQVEKKKWKKRGFRKTGGLNVTNVKRGRE